MNPVQAEVVHDQQVRCQKGADCALQRVVHPGLGHGSEIVVGVDEAHCVPGPDGGIAQGLGQEALAHSGRSDEQHVLAPGQELQGEGGVQQPSVQGDGRRPVEVLQPAGLLKAGLLQPRLNAPVSAAVDLVAENDFQEGGIVQLLPPGMLITGLN